MQHHADRPAANGHAPVALALAATGTIATLALTLLTGAPASAWGPSDGLHCDAATCLRYDQAQLVAQDTDGDGFTDADEKAAGTDPEDPTSHPGVLELVDLAAARALPSFEEHASELVILPDALPEGTKLGERAGVLALAEALGGLAPSRKEGLARLGISADLLGEFGVGTSDVLSIAAGLETAKDQPAFEVRVGGQRLSWIAAGTEGGTRSGVGVDPWEGEDGTQHNTVRWFEETDAGTVSYTVDIEMCGANCMGDVEVTVKGGGQDDDCSTWEGIGCFGDLGEVADKAFDLLKEQQKGAAASPKPAESQPTEPKAEPSPAATSSAQPAPQPSTSQTPEPATSETPKAESSESPKPSDGGYRDPDADQTRVVIRPGDVRRVVRLVRGSNTTPAEVDVQRPELDPAELGPKDLDAWREQAWEAGVLTTLSPVRTGEANSNYGPQGPRP